MLKMGKSQFLCSIEIIVILLLFSSDFISAGASTDDEDSKKLIPFNQTIQEFAVRKNIEPLPLKFSKVCYELCNHKTKNCIIKPKPFISKKDTNTQLQYDEHAIKYLNKIKYIKSNENLKYGRLRDLDVTCLNCQGHTEGTLCQSCKRGFYDTFQMKRIEKMKNMWGSLEEKILQIPINCEPCLCSDEGSHSYICHQYPEYGSKFIPKNNLSKSNMTVIEAGNCDCKKGYMGKHCNQCNLDDDFYTVKELTLTKWNQETKKANLPSINRTCVENCHDNKDCSSNDFGAQCRDGHCICSWEKFGPWCEYETVSSQAIRIISSYFVMIMFVLFK